MTRSRHHKKKGRRSTGAAQHTEELADPSAPAPMGLELISQLFETLFDDAVTELISKDLILREDGENEVESLSEIAPQTLADFGRTFAEFQSKHATERNSSLKYWAGFPFRLVTGATGTLKEIEVDETSVITFAEEHRIVELLTALKTTTDLASMTNIATTVSDAASQQQQQANMPFGAADDEFSAESFKKILPPDLASSPLFMNIIDMVTSELTSSGLMSELESELAPMAALAKVEPTEEPEHVEDPDLPPMPESVRKIVEEEKAKKDKKAKSINPAIFMKISETLMSTQGGGNSLTMKLRGMAEKISSEVKGQLAQNTISQDDIKRDLTAALQLVSGMGLGMGLPQEITANMQTAISSLESAPVD